MKKIFIIDWTLLPVFILTLLTGIGLHTAGHGSEHEVWHTWAVAHAIVGLLFLIATAAHIQTHRGWYQSFMKNGRGKKSRITAAVTISFLFVTITGLMLLGVEGANSSVGLIHYKAGLLSGILFAGHIIKRIPLLRRSLSKK